MSRDATIQDMSFLPTVSIIIPTFNREKYVGNCIYHLLNQNYPRSKFEIIVVIDPKTKDATETILNKLPVQYIVGSRTGAASCRNEGAAKANGEIFAFIDDDSVVDRDWLKNLVQNLRNEDFAGVGGSIISPHKNVYSEYRRIFSNQFNHWDLKKGRKIEVITKERYRMLPSGNIAIRKDIFQDLGGFDPLFLISAEDRDFLWRLLKKGYKMVFDSDVITYHYGEPSNLLTVAKKAYLRGYARNLFYKKHPDFITEVYGPKSLRWGKYRSLVKFFLLFAIVILVPVFLPVYALLFPIFIIYILLAIKYSRLKPSGGFKHAYFFPIIKLVAFISWNLALLRGLIKFR